MQAKEKFARIFAASPWLRTSKNVIHMPVLDPERPADKPSQTLPGVTWSEVCEMVEKS